MLTDNINNIIIRIQIKSQNKSYLKREMWFIVFKEGIKKQAYGKKSNKMAKR